MEMKYDRSSLREKQKKNSRNRKEAMKRENDQIRFTSNIFISRQCPMKSLKYSRLHGQTIVVCQESQRNTRQQANSLYLSLSLVPQWHGG